MGKRGVPAHEVGTEAAEELAVSIKGQYCVDNHMQDQIIVLMALANGKSVVKCGPPTLHTKTAIYIAEMLTNVSITLLQQFRSLKYTFCFSAYVSAHETEGIDREIFVGMCYRIFKNQYYKIIRVFVTCNSIQMLKNSLGYSGTNARKLI